MDKLYELNLDLFGHVIPKVTSNILFRCFSLSLNVPFKEQYTIIFKIFLQESKVHLRGSEVLVSLKKSQPGTWQRLLTTKEKVN